MIELLEPTTERNLAVFLGFAVAFVLAGLWVRGGRRAYLFISLACGVLTVILLVVGHFVVTDREAVETTLRQIADDVGRNDLPAAVRHVHSSSPGVRRTAEIELPKYRFQRVDIARNLKVDVNSASQPRTAVAEFTAIVYLQPGSPFSEYLDDRGARRRVTVHFQKEDDLWKVTDYSHGPVLQ